MEHIINIFGLIGEIPNEAGEIITPNTTFLDVVNKVEAVKDFTTLRVIINSVGGYVEEGDDIYDYLVALKKKGVTVDTVAKSQCASIATKIIMAGDSRIIDTDCVFMIHNPFANPEGDADTLEAFAKSLRRTENDLIQFYAGATGTSESAIKPLMRKETFLTPEQALSLGFATEILLEVVDFKAVACLKDFNTNIKTKKEMSKKDDKTQYDNFFVKAEKLFDKLLSVRKTKNKMVFDAEEHELDFYELADDDNVTKGAKAKVDGKEADGEYKMPSGETYVFKAGVLDEIKAAESDEDEDEGTVEELNAEVKTLKEQLKTSENKYRALSKKHKALESVNAEQGKGLKKLKKGIAKMKALGSDFQYDGKKDGKGKKQTGTRSVWKRDK